MKPAPVLRQNNLSENQFSYVVIYCIATVLSFIILAVVVHCLSQKKKRNAGQPVPHLPIDEESDMYSKKIVRRDPWKFWWNDYFRGDAEERDETTRFTHSTSPDSTSSE